MTKRSETVVFFGNEKLATGIPSVRPVIREAVEAVGFEIEKIVTGGLKELGTHTSRLAILAAYGHIIPQSVLDEFPLGIINIHPSLLPEYRGSTPIETAILDGKVKTGVSIMRLEAGMDTGPIYKQKTVHLSGAESKVELTKTLQQLGAELLVEVLPAIADSALKPRQQPHPDRATYTRLLSKDDGIIDWQKPARIIEREIRAFSGWPKSQATLGDISVIVNDAKVTQMAEVASPGKMMIEKKSLFIGTGKDWLEILRLQPQGKKEMPVEAFLAGYRDRL